MQDRPDAQDLLEELAAWLGGELAGRVPREERFGVRVAANVAAVVARELAEGPAAVEAERARADAAAATVRDEPKKPRKLVPDDATALSTAKLQRQIEELRAQVKHEQDARKELEELLDQNAENLEQTIQDYEAKLDALGAGADDARPAKPKKSRQG
jgi:chromosome segregation ATPase